MIKHLKPHPKRKILYYKIKDAIYEFIFTKKIKIKLTSRTVSVGTSTIQCNWTQEIVEDLDVYFNEDSIELLNEIIDDELNQ